MNSMQLVDQNILKNGVCLIEWGELVEPILSRYIKIEILKDDNDLDKRYINITFKGDPDEDFSYINF